MATHDYVIDNQNAPNFRADLNAALAAIATTNGNPTAPSSPFANQLWVDTTANQLKIRNEDNDAWIVLADLNQTADTSAPPDSSITFAKLAAATVVTAAETIASNNNDTTIPTSAAVKAYADAAVGGITQYTDAQARAAQAGHSGGSVGTYAFCRYAVNATNNDVEVTVSPGDTVSGSSLRYSSADTAIGSPIPAGTWRCMGAIINTRSGNNEEGFTYSNPPTLWLRIS
jgi:hypothetical protein